MIELAPLALGVVWLCWLFYRFGVEDGRRLAKMEAEAGR